jgi:hypothetical protein
MKSILKDLFFDKELVSQIRESKVNADLLYIQLMNGRITMQEYVAAL